jgi:hypothetical protein
LVAVCPQPQRRPDYVLGKKVDEPQSYGALRDLR